MVAYYSHDIAKWMDGTESLDDGEYRAYHVICELIYLNDGPIVMHESGIAGRCNQHPLKFRRNFQRLCEKGKLQVVAGKITNGRASKELERIEQRRKSKHGGRTLAQPPADPQPTPPTTRGGSQGGSAEVARGSRGGKASKLLKNKDAPMDVGHPIGDVIDGDSGEVRANTKIENPNGEFADVNVGAGRPFNDWPPDAFDRCWQHYPQKVAKDVARKAFTKVQKNPPMAWGPFCTALRRYIKKTDDRPWCHFSTWLNQGRWTDEPIQEVKPMPRRTSHGAASVIANRIRERVDAGE